MKAAEPHGKGAQMSHAELCHAELGGCKGKELVAIQSGSVQWAHSRNKVELQQYRKGVSGLSQSHSREVMGGPSLQERASTWSRRLCWMAGAVHTDQVHGHPAMPLLAIYPKVGTSPCRDMGIFMSVAGLFKGSRINLDVCHCWLDHENVLCMYTVEFYSAGNKIKILNLQENKWN